MIKFSLFGYVLEFIGVFYLNEWVLIFIKIGVWLFFFGIGFFYLLLKKFVNLSVIMNKLFDEIEEVLLII